MWFGLWAISQLIVLSIIGAFFGAEKAKMLFNSPPLIFFWFLLLFLLIAGFFTYPKLIKSPGLLLMHLGGIFILIGGMAGSRFGIELTNKLFNQQKFQNGFMALYENQSQNKVLIEDPVEEYKQLPFDIKLRNFRIEYYPNENNIKNYCSDITIIQNAKDLLNASIKVNHPLHFAGFHIYQYSYSPQTPPYTVLQIAADNGLYIVYTGYFLFCLGVFWHFWFRRTGANHVH
jgi:hypothetical protein